MIQRMSTMFLRTLREDPADAEVPSHRLMVRAGYIRRVAPGIFSWLPLGWRVYQNIERIIREEMNAAGAQEIHLPALLPREPYEKTDRWTEYGDSIFRLKDRKGNDMLLGPTHEEIFALTVKEVFSSYKDLPVSIYQIQWKYRDEQRPRAGILRGREFSMKDSYSFDIDEAGLERSYFMHREVYKKAFDRLGLEYVIVRAHSGAMGGSLSEEFLTPAEVGEDTYVRCTNCDYAANTETVEVPVPDSIPYEGLPAPHVEDTPDSPTIETLVDLLNAKHRRDDRAWRASDTLKNVALKVTSPTGETSVLVIGVPGDREVDEKRLDAQLYPSTFEPLTEEDFTKHPELVRGYIGPQALGEDKPGGIRYLVDPRVVSSTRWVTGANEPGRHVLDLVAGRDFQPDGTILAAEVREDDPCPRCGSTLTMARGIEIAHVFALGTKYAEALGVSVLDENGKQVTVTMGSYGFGVSRLVAVIAENNHDDKGLIWPREVSPFDVHIVATGKSDEPFEAAEKLAAELDAAGVKVVLDDRRASTAGEKFNDADLIGVPTIVVCGRRIVDGKVEIKDRRTSERIDVPIEEALDHLTR